MSDEITEPTVHLCWNDFAIRGAVHALRMAHLDTMADDLEAQLRPAVEEPQRFGSIVRAKLYGPLPMLWQRSHGNGKHYWESEAGAVEVWSELKDAEVLRVGIGEQESADEWHRLDVANAQTDAFAKGAEGLRLKILDRLRILLSAAVTAERKDAYEIAIRTAEGTRP